jgi:antibiotic biosynthesis monooxygenase (ABM) superfamily enzyme
MSTSDTRPRRGHSEESVTTVYSWRAKPDRVDEFAEWARGATAEAARYPGNLAATVVHDEDSRDFHVVHQFATRRDLRNWLDSPEREKWLRHARTLAATKTAQQHRTGLETWFHVPSEAIATMKPPPRWKMWLISLVSVYPLVLAFQAWVVPMTASWPLWLRAALFPVVLLTTMTYVVMPAVTRLLRRWL